MRLRMLMAKMLASLLTILVLAASDAACETVGPRAGETGCKPLSVARLERDRDCEPERAAGHASKNVRKVVNPEIETAEADQCYEHDRASKEEEMVASVVEMAPRQIRKRPVGSGRHHRVAAREGIGLKVDEPEFGARPVE